MRFSGRTSIILTLVLSVPTFASAAGGRWEVAIPENVTGWTSSALFRDGTGYIASGTGRLYKTSDGGGTWIPLPEANGSIGAEYSFATPDTGYAVSGGGISKTTDGGLTWRDLGTPPRPQEIEEPRAVLDALSAARGADHLIVTGWGSVRPEQNCAPRRSDHYSWVSEDGGRSWSRSRIGFPAVTYEIEQLNARVGLLLVHGFGAPQGSCNAATQQTDRSVVLLTRNGGRTFKRVHVAFFGDEDPVVSVAIPTPSRILLGTREGRILLSEDGGRDFGVVAELPAGTGGANVVDALAFGTRRFGYAGTNGTGVWRTTDGGRTWTEEESPYDAGYEDGFGLRRGTIAAAGARRGIAAGPGAITRRRG